MYERDRSAATNGEPLSRDPFEHEDFGEFMDSMAGEAKSYWTAQKEYYTFVASEKAATASAGLLNGLVLGLIVASILVFLSLAGAIWIGRLLGDMALGFLSMAGVYLVLGLLFMIIWRSGFRDRYILGMFNSIYHDQPNTIHQS
jgi:hypothetical protein